MSLTPDEKELLRRLQDKAGAGEMVQSDAMVEARLLNALDRVRSGRPQIMALVSVSDDGTQQETCWRGNALQAIGLLHWGANLVERRLGGILK